jgi:RNA polymerase sigma-70 factor, ECF subfamily
VDEAGSDIERTIRAAHEGGDFQAAAIQALDAYGSEILSFLAARLRTRSDAEEVFAMFAEDLWRGLRGFSFRCTVRGWMYALARNAANRYITAPHKRAEQNLSASEAQRLSVLVEQVRSATEPAQRTDAKEKVRALRDRLALEDQTLLILHVDRNLPWRELALVMHDAAGELDSDGITREASRLRKRFERLKSELRQMAVAEGLLEP